MADIRKMEPSEAALVKKLAKKSFVGMEQFFVSTPKEAMLALKDNKIVGGIMIKYIITKDQKIGYIDTAFIVPEYQGKGIGGILYEKTVQYLWGQGCTGLSALVKDDNVGSWQLFLNNGFSQTSIALCEWCFMLVLTISAVMFQSSFTFLPLFISLGKLYLLYYILAVYPFESYGGRRIYLWNKGIYAILAMPSAFVIIIR